MDLLAHEPVVAVLLGCRQVPVDVVAPALDRRAVEVGDRDALAGDRHDLVLPELQRLTGVLDEGRDVGPEEVLALADPYHQRAVAPRGHHPGGVETVDGHERERALETPARRLHGGGQVTAGQQLELEQPRRDLGVGVRLQLVPGVLELGAQRGEVLDDPVVHQRDAAGRAEVRVRVGVGRRSVRGPAGVADAGRRLRERVVGQLLLEVGQLAGLLADATRPSSTSAIPAES